jgi:uncharacterized Ntn-hydrolase superfamily protein
LKNCHTYSIVARDSATGQLGVAVQSHWFSVGAVVSWAEAGIGAVATQSFIDPEYGPSGLRLIRSGMSAPEALSSLVWKDEQAERRQVAMIDFSGRVQAHTGNLCVGEAGHHIGAQYSTQANMMLRNTVWDAMAEAYENANGDLAERMLSALEAAETQGGDIRGRQSAAILVVRPETTGQVWKDRIFDLRVDDHPTPVQELRRLVQLSRAYDHMNLGDDMLGEGNVAGACNEYGTAEQLAENNAEMIFWHAVTLTNAGRIDEATPLFKKAFAQDRNWFTMLTRLPRAKLLTEDPDVINVISRLAP